MVFMNPGSAINIQTLFRGPSDVWDDPIPWPFWCLRWPYSVALLMSEMTLFRGPSDVWDDPIPWPFWCLRWPYSVALLMPEMTLFRGPSDAWDVPMFKGQINYTCCVWNIIFNYMYYINIDDIFYTEYDVLIISQWVYSAMMVIIHVITGSWLWIGDEVHVAHTALTCLGQRNMSSK